MNFFSMPDDQLADARRGKEAGQFHALRFGA